MTQRIRRRTLSAASLAVGAALALACGEPSLEERMDEAIALVESAELHEAHAREVVANAELSVAEAETARDEALAKLREAETALADAHEKAAEYLTDDVLFRAVQQQLLDDPMLADDAIAAQVGDRRATLRGHVADEEHRERALSIARTVPGIVSVDDALSIAPESTDAPSAESGDEAPDVPDAPAAPSAPTPSEPSERAAPPATAPSPPGAPERGL